MQFLPLDKNLEALYYQKLEAKKLKDLAEAEEEGKAKAVIPFEREMKKLCASVLLPL